MNSAVIDAVLGIAGMATGLLVGLFALGILRGSARKRRAWRRLPRGLRCAWR